MASNDVSEWFRSIPPVTRFLFAGTFAVTLAGNFGLVNPMSLILIPETFSQLQVSFHYLFYFSACVFFSYFLYKQYKPFPIPMEF